MKKMKIVLIANDAKKELMIQFCNAYKGELSKHKLCSTAATGKMINRETGLDVMCFLGGYHGGYQQISSLISCGEIDMVVFFRDGMNPEVTNLAQQDLMRLCDIQPIPLATNIATAEMLLHGLKRGDLSWREIGDPVI